MLEIVTSASYWVLVVLWLVILWLYIDSLRVSRSVDKTIAALLLILAIDAFRTLFESAYFGLYFNSLFGFLPIGVFETLSHPSLMVVPKLLNIIAGLLVLFLLIRHWIPREIQQRQAWIDGLRQEKRIAEHQREAAEVESRKLQSVLDAIPDAILITDTQRRIVSINRGMRRVFGYSIDELAGKKTSVIYASEEDYELQGRLRFNLSAEEKAAPYEVEYKHKDGRLFPGETMGVVLHDAAGEVSGYIGVIRDITERKDTENKLRLAASVFTHAREGIAITDARACIIDVNDTLCEMSGYERDELLGSNPRILHSGLQKSEFFHGMWESLINRKHWTGEILNRGKDGEVMTDLVTISAVCDDDDVVQHYVGLFTDITRIKEDQYQLEYAAHYDALTSLPNRVLLADRLVQAMTHSQRRKNSVAVAYLDLDEFKAVNDKYGHSAGDRLLVDVSKRVLSVLREGDTLTRIGGDEFVVVLADIEKMSDCEKLLLRILHVVSEPILLEEYTLKVSASIGVTVYPQDLVEAEQLIRHADQAMYTAKQQGKNTIHIFNTVENDAALDYRQFIQDVRLALERQELVLYYQPKVNLESGEVIGFEALIRWQHPERGLLTPDLFIPRIDNHEISVDIGDWVITTALEQIRRWQALGLDIAVSVNVSPRQLQAEDFVAKISGWLSGYPSITPNLLELEILESSAMSDINEVSKVMYDCLQIGVCSALDDFGTGYSSLEYLKLFPAGFLKIDKSFIRDMTEDTDDKTIVSAVIGLAASFHCTAIAEGVETSQQRRQLLAMGCKFGQGFGIARPMPAERVPGWLKEWKSTPHWAD